MELNDAPKHTNPETGEDFSRLLEEYGRQESTYRVGQLIEGEIVKIEAGSVLVSLLGKSEGIVPRKDFEALPRDVRESLKEGDRVYAYVERVEDENGNVLLSLSKAILERDWQRAEALFTQQTVVEEKVAGFNKGGLIIKLGRLRGFMPASQLSPAHQKLVGDDDLPPEQRFQSFVGQTLAFKVIEVDRENNRLILSERAAMKEVRAAQKARLISTLEEGSILEGVVSSVLDFGVFVDLGGVDGMVPLSEISRVRITKPSDVLKQGQTVKVKVVSIDREKGRISLSMKALEQDPWENIGQRYRKGQLVEAEVIKTHPKYGAFVRLKNDAAIEALVPLSELSDKPIQSPHEVVKPGQLVTLRIMRIEPEARRMALSLRQVSWAEFAHTDWQAELESGPASES
ncbi:MAG: 30S ribosomal protein S1 [Thermoflexales bacterium]